MGEDQSVNQAGLDALRDWAKDTSIEKTRKGEKGTWVCALSIKTPSGKVELEGQVTVSSH